MYRKQNMQFLPRKNAGSVRNAWHDSVIGLGCKAVELEFI